jgi:L-asparaginase / beta-aspartyl-peptidase
MAAIVVHGGAWAIPQELTQASLDGCERAAHAGWKVLTSGGTSIDAVEAAVRVLEEDEAFDAGKGAVLTSAGTVELDAVIMEGQGLRAGAVAAIGPVLHPISVSRMVMEQTPHVLLVGEGATAFARANNVPILPEDDLVTPAARTEWEKMKAFPNSVNQLFNRPKGVDTVGAVAVDTRGVVAAGTSTGGISCKLPGRVGDSPIVGAGCIADNESGAVSCTGHGEAIMLVVLAQRVASQMEQGQAPGAAAATGLAHMQRRLDGHGGVISVSADGRAGLAFSTERMAWAAVSADGNVRRGIDHETKSDRGLTVLEFA